MKRDTFFANYDQVYFHSLDIRNRDKIESKLRHHYDLRKAIIRTRYPLTRWHKVAAWVIAGLYIGLCWALIIAYGLQFDLSKDYYVSNELFSSAQTCGASLTTKMNYSDLHLIYGMR